MVVQLGEAGGDGSLGEEDFDQSEEEGSFLTILISPSCLDLLSCWFSIYHFFDVSRFVKRTLPHHLLPWAPGHLHLRPRLLHTLLPETGRCDIFVSHDHLPDIDHHFIGINLICVITSPTFVFLDCCFHSIKCWVIVDIASSNEYAWVTVSWKQLNIFWWHLWGLNVGSTMPSMRFMKWTVSFSEVSPQFCSDGIHK